MTEARTSGDAPEAVPANKAFAAQRNKIRQLEEELADTRRELEDAKFSSDPETAQLQRTIRSLESRLDQMALQGVDDDKIEGVYAQYPWVRSIPNKVDRIQAVKDILAVDQQAGTNAGDSPESKGRSKSEAAAQAHLTGGGPPASGGSRSTDDERELAEFQKKMREAKNQSDRDKLADDWAKNHPGEEPL